MAVKRESCRRNRRAPSTIACDRSAPVRARWESCEPRPASRSSFEASRRRAGAPVPMTTRTVEMVTSSITSSSSPCRIATPRSRCTRRTPYLLRVRLSSAEIQKPASHALLSRHAHPNPFNLSNFAQIEVPISFTIIHESRVTGQPSGYQQSPRNGEAFRFQPPASGHLELPHALKKS
jgi:hypothetical protein